MRRVFAELGEIVFQCVGNKGSDWWSEILCCHVNFKCRSCYERFSRLLVGKKFSFIFVHKKGLGHMFQKKFSCSPILSFCVAASQK